MIKNKLFLDVKEMIEDVVVPKDENLVLIKIKEVFQIQSEDINVELIKGRKIYSVRYKEIQFQLVINKVTERFEITPHFDIFDENDCIIESY